MGAGICRGREQANKDRDAQAGEFNEAGSPSELQVPAAPETEVAASGTLKNEPESSFEELPSPLRKERSHALLWIPQPCAEGGVQINNNGQCTHAQMMEDYVTIEVLTSNAAASCTVEHCRQLSTQSDVVVKIFNRGLMEQKARRSLSMVQRDALQELRREIAIMQKLRHPNIVHQQDMIESADGMLYIVMEYVPGGPTMRWNEAEWKYDSTAADVCDSLPVNTARSYFRDALLGLEYIHAQNIVHRDMKPENLLVNQLYVPGKEPSGASHVKIADFGVSCFVSVGDDQISDTQGTLLFEAPESFSGEPYSGFSSDVWALGVTLFCFLYQNVPFENGTLHALAAAIQEKVINLPDDTPPELRALFGSILAKDPSKRATIDQLKRDPWVLEGLDQDELVSPVPLHPIKVTDAEVEGALAPKTRTNYLALITKIKVQMRKLKEASKTPKSAKNQLQVSPPVSPSSQPGSPSSHPQIARVKAARVKAAEELRMKHESTASDERRVNNSDFEDTNNLAEQL